MMLNPVAGALSAILLLAAPALADCENDCLPANEARADLTYLYTSLEAAHVDLFAATPRSVFEARYAALMEAFVEPVPCGVAHAEFQRFAALARHAHTHMSGLNPDWPAFAAADGPVFPLDFRVHQGEVIVTAAPADSNVRPGDRILSLNGEPNPVWLARIRRGISAETAPLAYARMEAGGLYYIWLEYGALDRFSLDIQRDGEPLDVEVAAIPLSALEDRIGAEPGFSLAGRDAHLVEDGIAYLRPGPFLNIEATTPEAYWDPQALTDFRAFINAAFEDFLAAGTDNLILDLRDNPGGDNSWSDPVVAWFADERFRFASDFRVRVSDHSTAANQARLDAQAGSEASGDAGSVSQRYAALFAQAEPGEIISFEIDWAEPRAEPRFHGRVHVLVNRRSFSNAVTTAALIQDYGFGTLYGEATTDLATTYGAMEHFTLPNSGWRVGYPKAHIIRPNGRTDPHAVEPDVRLDVPVSRGERDVVLDQLVALIRGQAD